LSGARQTETTKTMEILNRTQTGQGTHFRTLCLKNQRTVKIKQNPVMVGGRTIGHCHLKGHIFKMGLADCPICERCLERDESATHILHECEVIAYYDSVTWATVSWNQTTIMMPL
jgi:hypothetical protein